MATKDRAEMVTFLLEHLGITPAGVAGTAADQATAGTILDSAYARLQQLELAPFALGSIPDWAQIPLAQITAVDCVQPFQLGPQAKSQIEADAARARVELREQTSVRDQNLPVRFRDF